MRFIDSHVHLCEYSEPAETIRAARSSRTLLVSSGINRATSEKTLRLGTENPDSVLPFVGVHPSEGGKEADFEWVARAAMGARGVGEIGLDPSYSDSPMKGQLAAFNAQLSVAERLRKPVQVHSRGAEKECLEVLSSFRPPSVLMHWFQGESLLAVLRDRGYFTSFGPALLHSGRLQRMARSFDRTLVLAETDGPVRYGALGGVEGPALIPSVVFKLSELWGTNFEECRSTLLSNGRAYIDGRTKG